MEQIPIQIKTKESNDSRTMRSDDQNNNGKNGRTSKVKRGFFFWFLLVLILISAGAITFLYLTSTTPPFYSLLPPNPIVTAYFSQSSLYDLSQTFKSSQMNWTPLASANQYFSAFITRSGLNVAEISSILEDKMSLVLLPPTTGNKPVWLFFATEKNSSSEVASIIENTKRTLKQNFNLISDTYRQIDTEEIKPLNQNQASIFFAQPKNIFLLSNDSQTLKNTIDKALQ